MRQPVVVARGFAFGGRGFRDRFGGGVFVAGAKPRGAAGGLFAAGAGVEGVEIAAAFLGENLIALLHLIHHPAQREKRLLGIGDDGQREVRQIVIALHFHDLGIDHDEAQFIRREAAKQLVMMLLMQTDLPLPVAPATSRCGIDARSATMALP